MQKIKNIILIIIILALTILTYSTIKLHKENEYIKETIDYMSGNIRKLSIMEVNQENWNNLIRERTGLDIPIPNEWTIKSVSGSFDKTEPSNITCEIVFNMAGNITYEDYTQIIFEKIKNISFDKEVMSFSKDNKYYNINSFKETTYNNMYYDYDLEGYGTSGNRNKVKIIENREFNTITIEINKF